MDDNISFLKLVLNEYKYYNLSLSINLVGLLWLLYNYSSLPFIPI